MYFKSLIGNKIIKALLLKEVSSNKIPHAQLFIGAKGCGKLPMALAFTTYLFCENKMNEDSCGVCGSCIKMFKLTHPDLHFVFPTIAPPGKVGKKIISESKKHFPKFQKSILNNPYLSVKDWKDLLGGKNKKVGIRKSDTLVMCKMAELKPYAGLYKVFIVWCAEKMNPEASNAFLKSLEEPNSKTVFILISDFHHNLLGTIQSRVQVKNFEKIDADLLFKHVTNRHPSLAPPAIKSCISASDNNYSEIIRKLDADLHVDNVYKLFVNWIRLCFLSVNKKSQFLDPEMGLSKGVISELIAWCDNISALERDSQLEFLVKSSDIFRKGFLLNYHDFEEDLNDLNSLNFNFNNFSKYIKNHNISDIFELINNTYYYLNRYANSKILFLDLSLSLGKLLHKTN